MIIPITPTDAPRPMPTYAPVESWRPPDDWLSGTAVASLSGGEVGDGVEDVSVVLESARLTYDLDPSVVVDGWTGVDAKVNAIPEVTSDKQSPVIWPGMPLFNEYPLWRERISLCQVCLGK